MLQDFPNRSNSEILSLKEGDEIKVALDNESVMIYKVYTIDEYKRIQSRPLDVFVDLKDNKQYSERLIFDMYYKLFSHTDLVLQTCIEKDGNKIWGVRFVVALPIKKLEREMK